MKRLMFAILAASFLIFGCENSSTTSTQNESLNFDVTGDDAPATYQAAMDELAELDIAVPDPVTDENLAELNMLNTDADMVAISHATLDEGDRPGFRRIIHHLHERFQGMRECLANNDSRELRRIVYGAHQAMRHGMRALENENPRRALHAFHRANRLLNLAERICNGEEIERP